ncbi:MAG: hypothetical protein KME46_19820 [Brasilonema angustatum HA4187-MV1]|nr:hypothetical protein [Brasilonema angustatum HA4187-MV1]
MANATPYGYRVRQMPTEGNPPAALVSPNQTGFLYNLSTQTNNLAINNTAHPTLNCSLLI